MDILNRCVTMGVMLKAVSLSILAEMSAVHSKGHICFALDVILNIL